ncbi:MAG: vitamin K epoxide reductase family protein [Candidatus Colwellbacteria bacterium]|nr:vitamin K epoxide reductase family protein [Candidatus Colwellbacteria bacterium]
MRFVASGNSMLPVYPAGSKLFVSRAVCIFYRPKVGDAVVLRDPRNGRLILKRIKSGNGGEYWVEGDNPVESTDSRSFGLVKREDIIGKVMCRYPRDIKTWLTIFIIILAVIGLADSLYLTYAHYQQNSGIVCSLGFGVCDEVTTSKYSVIFGIPLAAFGIIFYLLVLVPTFLYKRNGRQKTLRVLWGWVTLGFGVSIYLIYLQAFVLHAYCPLCLASATLSALIFLGVFLLSKKSNNRARAGV